MQFLVNKANTLHGRFAHATWAGITLPFFISFLMFPMPLIFPGSGSIFEVPCRKYFVSQVFVCSFVFVCLSEKDQKRDYKKFQNVFSAKPDNELVNNDLKNLEYQHFPNPFTEVLNQHTLLTTKNRI